MAIELTEDEKKHLDNLNGKLTHIKDAVRGVAKDFHTGLLLWGEGGTGKSYSVLEELQKLRAKYVYHNARITGRGLVDALQRAPSDVHVIEDAETLLDDKRAWGVLRAALWSQSKTKPPEREITWTAFKLTIRFIFTGGVIVISNANLAETKPEIRALKGRVRNLGLDISNHEIQAMMKKICQDGYTYGEDYLTPAECWEVGQFIIDKLEALHRNLDLRLLLHGFHDYLQWKTGHAVNHWHVLLEGRMQERVLYRPRAEQKAEESRIALEIHKMKMPGDKRLQLWKERTGLKQAAYYRALQRLGVK
jgi:hypothetical protein